MTEDRELLRQYLEMQSERAFSELVARHIALVYGTALRRTTVIRTWPKMLPRWFSRDWRATQQNCEVIL